MIELKGINKSYGNIRVLDNVSLSIGNNEIITIVGPSGAGKTTLLRMAGTLDRPDSGSVFTTGRISRGLTTVVSPHSATATSASFFSSISCCLNSPLRENVALPAMIAGESGKGAQKRAAELLGMLGLGDRLRHKPAQMSGGERQRGGDRQGSCQQPESDFRRRTHRKS